MRRRIGPVLLVTALAVLACAEAAPSQSVTPVGAPSLGAGEFALPTISPPSGTSPEACPAALMTGILIEHPDGGLGLEGDDGSAARVRWPFGWRGSSGPPVALVDETGSVVATVGQRLEVGGGMVQDGWWLGCGGVTVLG